MTPGLPSLVDVLQRHQLLAPEQLREVLSWPSRHGDPGQLISVLIARGWLTSYQGEQLRRGQGDRLKIGPYLLLEKLGEGGMGQVFKASYRAMQRTVALKVLRQERLDSPGVIERFEREIRAVARLSHSNVVQAFDAARTDGGYLLVLEFVEGTDLASLLRRQGPLPIEQACAHIRQAALGLEHAHQAGIVHRDIKPSNLILDARTGQIKVLDFGLALLHSAACSADETTPELTKDGAVMGTPDYMAPEQTEDPHAVDIRADIYGLGCTLYFLLTGKPPFPGGTAVDKLIRHRTVTPEPVALSRPDVPPELAAVLSRMMAKAPAERYPRPAAVAEALAPWAEAGG